MPLARRVCNIPGCPTLTTQGRCPAHEREADQARGTRQQRGYNRSYDRTRRHWQGRLNTGEPIPCTNPHCLTPDIPVNPLDWHLGHTPDRDSIRGPEHPTCNLSEAGRSSHPK